MYFFFFFDKKITNRINKTKRIAVDMELFADNRIISPLIIFCSQYTLFFHEVHKRAFFWLHILPSTFLCAPDLVQSYATKISFFVAFICLLQISFLLWIFCFLLALDNNTHIYHYY